MKLSKEIKTAILVLLGILLFIFGFNYLKGENLLDSSRIFYTEYDNVEGLMPSTPVTISGKPVGKVKDISFKNDGSGKLQVTLLVDSEFQFSKSSTAELYETGLIGGKAVAIIPAFDGSENAKDGDVLKGTIKAGLTELVNKRLTPLQVKIEAVMVNTDSLLGNLNDVFDQQTKVHLKESIEGLSATLNSFKETSNSLNQVIAGNQEKINNVMENADKSLANFSEITNTISEADLGNTIKNLESTLQNFNSMLAGVEKGEGSMGKLLKDEALYNNIEGATLQLEQLLEDMKLNPKRYVHFSLFGKKPKQYDAEGNEVQQ
ncbi:ABC transporter substrate-binding protein [Pseudalgibacter alginicilyticus]|uniref:ABC transporter substrate-binding protein n=1 Tax=Pseudalgibacter alginicilyticus TaxID=1736674 RepID=A0A0P0D8U8_9FLAO|nr:MlaD family protein [Pseudalgibacter alginicilyticus]ALJ04289.1 ABC transporter substrate-binding protein [Pseudalgibacter alginicilyticus]